MRVVTKIDGIVLDHSLYISSEFDIDNFIGERSITIDGSSVMFVQAKGAMTKEVQLYSGNNGWQIETTKDLIEQNVGTTQITLTFSDATTGVYYYDHASIPVTFKPLYDGSEWYNVTINLLKG